LLRFGTTGSGDGQFNSPRGIAVDSSGNIYVADTGNHRVQKFGVEAIASKGDANNDGLINMEDITRIALHIVQTQMLNAAGQFNADVSPGAGKMGTADPNTCGDGNVNVLDMIAIAIAILSGDAGTFLVDRCTL
jgi:DNA-binding beta-propeller fold protein YncE